MFAQVLERLRGEQVVVLPRTPEQRAELSGVHRPRARRRRAVADRLRRRRDLRRRHDEPRGGGARHAGLDDVRGPPRRRRRGADRRRPPAPADRRRGRRARAPRPRRRAAAHTPRPRGLHESVREGRVRRQPGAVRRRAASPNTLPRMRRRIRSAAFPIHRHAVPQVAMDAGLVALAYYLAYWLRFDGRHPAAATTTCSCARSRSRSSARSPASRSPACTGTGCATRRSASTSRSPRASCSRCSRWWPTSRSCSRSSSSAPTGFVSIAVPTGVLVLFGLLSGAFLTGTRYLVHFVYERPLRGFRPRRDARSVLIVGAGDGGRLLLRELVKNPELGYRPVGFVDDDPRKQGMRVDRGLEVLGHDGRAAGGARGRRARRGADRGPVRARRRCARRVVQRLPRARRARAHDADGLRAAAQRTAA